MSEATKRNGKSAGTTDSRPTPPPRQKVARPGATVRPVPKKRPGKREKRGRSRLLLFGIPVVVVVVAVVIVALVAGGSTPSLSHQAAVNYTVGKTRIYGAIGPEGVPLQLGAPLAAANTGLTGTPIDGVGCDAGMTLVYHHHAHLSIFVNGQPRAIPLAIGIVPPAVVQNTKTGDYAQGSNKCLYWIHTHAQDGIIHLESAEPKTYELGQLFDIWGQPISSAGIGSTKGAVTATVNGTPWTGDPAQIPMSQHVQIVLNIGTPVVSPPPIQWSGTSL